jgi:hypothetical protein
MNKVAIDNKQFQEKVIQIYKEEETKILQEKWDGLTKNEKIFVLEFLRSNNKIKKGVISEAKWYNTIGDIVGVFDPTGLVDAVNAVSYFKQGDTLFGRSQETQSRIYERQLRRSLAWVSARAFSRVAFAIRV